MGGRFLQILVERSSRHRSMSLTEERIKETTELIIQVSSVEAQSISSFCHATSWQSQPSELWANQSSRKILWLDGLGSIGPRPSYDDNKWITSRNVTFEKIPKTSHRLNWRQNVQLMLSLSPGNGNFISGRSIYTEHTRGPSAVQSQRRKDLEEKKTTSLSVFFF